MLPNIELRNRQERRAAAWLGRGPDRIMRLREVCEIIGLSKASIYRLEKAGDFPRRCKLGNGTWAPVGWQSTAVYAWIDQRLADRDAKLQAAEDDNTLDSDDTVEDNEEDISA